MTYLNDELIHVALVLCGSNSSNLIESAYVLIKSIGLFTLSNVKFHIIRDNVIKEKLLLEYVFLFYF